MTDRQAPGAMTRAVGGVDTPAARPRSADATTVLAIFVVLQFLLPAKVILNYLPMSMSAATLVALGLAVLWTCTQMTTTLGAAKGFSPVRAMLFAYSCLLLASYANAAFGFLPADERSNSDSASVKVFALVLVALALTDGVRSRARLYFLVRVMVLCGAAVAVVGTLQFLLGLDLTPWLRPPGMHPSSTDPAVIERAGMRRVSATTAHPIEFGVFCAMLLPLGIHVAHRRARDRGRVVWWACVGLLATGVMFSISRSAVLAVAGVVLVLFCGWSTRRRLWMLVSGAGFLVFIQLLSPGLLRTFVDLFRNAGSDDSVRYRTHDYATAQELILENVLLGRGVGTWYAPKHTILDNQYLLTLVESGVLGLVAFLAILAAAVGAAARVMWLISRSVPVLATADTDRDLALALTATLAAVIPTYATFDFSAFATVSALSFLVVGLCGALLRIVTAEVSGEPVDEHAVL